MSVESNPANYTRVTDQSKDWGKNPTLDALKAAARTYNDPTITYSDPLVYYNGYNPGSNTPDGSAPSNFARVGQSTSNWTNPEEDEA